MRRLEGLQWAPYWVSHLGCVKGCLDYLRLDVSDGWLFGGTGHAFIINMHEIVCPSGPTAWNTERLFSLGGNIGYEVDGVHATKSTGADFAQKQAAAWQHVKQSIDNGIPCYGWELNIAEYYVVLCYDEVGYYFSGPGCAEQSGPKPWAQLGDTEISVLEMYSVRPGHPADDARTVKEALAFALEHATSPAKWVFPPYRAGLAGYESWIRALETRTADPIGMAYNAAVWNECRGHAVQFLDEARQRLPGKADSAFEQARRCYQNVHHNLTTVAQIFPFLGMDPAHIQESSRRSATIASLVSAREAEAAGLEALQEIVAAI